jgi:hypothetical protein
VTATAPKRLEGTCESGVNPSGITGLPNQRLVGTLSRFLRTHCHTGLQFSNVTPSFDIQKIIHL